MWLLCTPPVLNAMVPDAKTGDNSKMPQQTNRVAPS